MVHCANGDANECEAVVLTVPIPLLERDRASSAGTRKGGSRCAYRLRQHHQNLAKLREPLVARKPKGSCQSDIPAFGCAYTGLVDVAAVDYTRSGARNTACQYVGGRCARRPGTQEKAADFACAVRHGLRGMFELPSRPRVLPIMTRSSKGTKTIIVYCTSADAPRWPEKCSRK